jgi:hypothetical protein
MAYSIITRSGRVIMHKAMWGVDEEELSTDAIWEQLTLLDESIKDRIGNQIKNDKAACEPGFDHEDAPEGLFDNEEEPIADLIEPDLATPEADEYTLEAYSEYLMAEVVLPHGGESASVKVTMCKRNALGRPIGPGQPMLDTRMYEVEFPDGSTEAVMTNLIAENLYLQVNAEGNSFSVIKEIIDHRKDGHALSKDNGTTNIRQRRLKCTTQGWDHKCKLGDGTMTWIPLKDLKDSMPVQVAEYAIANKIAKEPAYAWWVQDILRHSNWIIGKVKTRYWKRTHKYGIELPKMIKQAYEIDEEMGTTFWHDAIEKEMKNVMPTFEFSDTDEISNFHKLINCHMVFDIKLGNLACKAWFAAGGHQTDPPKDMTYLSVVSRDSIRIAFLVTALNDLDVLTADIQNTYLNAPTSKKVYTITGLEFGALNVSRLIKIIRALYGLKSSGAHWRDHMAASLRDAGFVSCKADPDVWMRAAVKLNGDKYWAYVLCYVDNLLIVSHKPQEVMDFLSKKYTLKDGSLKEPTEYLGNQVVKWDMHDLLNLGKQCWAMSSNLYVKRAVSKVEKELGEVHQQL